MQRRARIKAVANLSTLRRSVNKNSSEISKKTSEIESDDGEKEIEKRNLNVTSSNPINESQESSSTKSPLYTSLHKISSDPSLDVRSSNTAHSATKNEKTSSQASSGEQGSKEQSITTELKLPTITQNESVTFKTPMQMSRNENEASGSHPILNVNKSRKFNIAPRLNSSRNVHRIHDNDDAHKKHDESQTEVVKVTPVIPVQDMNYELSPPTNDVPLFVVNHNVQHPGASPSPFHHFSHGRIRTESLCSIKSNRDVTMANLQPRKNIRTEDQKIIDIKRESRERLSNKDLDKSQLRMFDMIYFNPQNNPMKTRSPQKQEKPKKAEPNQEESIMTKEPSSTMPVPQLKIDANGDMVLDETSLVVENEQQRQNRILLASANVVYDDDLSGNYGYYKRQQRTKEWPHDETVKFYRCLNTVGTDFSLMLNLFPNRSRRDLKLKFKKEERTNPQLIDKALLKHNIFDLDELQRELDQEEEEQRKKNQEKNTKTTSESEVKELIKRKILKKQEAKQNAEQRTKTKVEKILSGGELAMSIVNNRLVLDVKENLELSNDLPNAKRQYNKKPKVEKSTDEAVLKPNIMDGLACEDVKSNVSSKKLRQSRKKAAISDIESSSNLLSGPSLLKKPRRSQKPIVEIIQNEIEDDSLLATAASVTKNCIKTEAKPTSLLNIMDYEVHHMKVESIPCTNLPSFFEEVQLNNSEDIQDAEASSSSATTSLFFDESTIKLDNLVTKPSEEIPGSESNKPPPLNDNQGESFNGEAFLNSLDLEKLVLVETRREGKDVYEIHEVDPVTQEICDKPIDLPARYVDLIISVMTQQDNDSE